jgi:hypothetical protein
VPRYKTVELSMGNGNVVVFWPFEGAAEKYDSGDTKSPEGRPAKVGPWQSLDIAFVAGCIWGDDSTWKLETIDLSRVHEGVISRTARFGHLQLAGRLDEAVQMHRSDLLPLRATIRQQQDWDVATGQLIDPYDL